MIIVLTCFLSSWKVEATNHLRKDSVSNNDSINIKEDFIYWISHMDDSATIENGIAEFNSFLSEYTKKNKIDITGWVDKYAETRDMLYKGEYLGRYLSYRLIVLYHLDFIKIEDNWENRLNFFLVCVKHNDYEVLDLLDFRDSALEGDSCYGETVLTVAVRGNNIKMVKYLLKRGVDINKREFPACYDDAVEEENAYEIALDLGYKDIADLLKSIDRVSWIIEPLRGLRDAVMGYSDNEFIGLFGKKGKFYMKPTKINRDVFYEYCTQDSLVSADLVEEDNCYLLFKDFIDYNSEPIDAVNEGKLIEMRPNTAFDFTYNGDKYKLKTEGEEDNGDTKNYKLYICSKQCKKEQVLVNNELVDDAYIEILFIGDLDGDSKPDIILNAPTNYENRYIMLFLSSTRRKGELLHLEASDFYWPGIRNK